MKKTLLLLFISFQSFAQIQFSEKLAISIMAIHKDSIVTKEGKPARWDYEQGLVLKAIEEVWVATGKPEYYEYIKKNIDSFIDEKGNIRTYAYDEFNLDNVLTGRVVLSLYRITGKENYKIAAETLLKQVQNQPKTQEGGYWHKQKYPNQMWLDGLYMAEPFSAEAGEIFQNPDLLDEACNQLVLMYKHAIDPKTGLLYHGWDESRKEKWANKVTGQSPNFWGRAMGWYAMALVDVLDYLPSNHPNKKQLVQLLQNCSLALEKYQDPKTGCWWQILDKANQEGNYLESSSTAMFCYALAKASRKGYIEKRFSKVANKAYTGMLKNFVIQPKENEISINKTVSVGGLGGNPYRNGSYEYYLSEPIKMNDLKGVGPFIMASLEIEKLQNNAGENKIILLDNYFNNEFRNIQENRKESYHYTLNDRRDSGYYTFGKMVESYYAKTETIKTAPTPEKLADKSVYIIVDPDTAKETENPHYMDITSIEVIEKWVKDGGKLLLLQNDTGNAEYQNFNKLAERFGFSFIEESNNKVEGKKWEMGKFDNLPNHPIFKDVSKIYMKEIPSIKIEQKGKKILERDGMVFIAEFAIGKGKVIAICDPWFYNEYVDGRRLPQEFQNYKATKNLVKWLLEK